MPWLTQPIRTKHNSPSAISGACHLLRNIVRRRYRAKFRAKLFLKHTQRDTLRLALQAQNKPYVVGFLMGYVELILLINVPPSLPRPS